MSVVIPVYNERSLLPLVLEQDADLESDPREYAQRLEPPRHGFTGRMSLAAA